MEILEKPIGIAELKKIAAGMFGDMVKAVVDTDRRLIALDAELHADLEALLLEAGSRQQVLWGINLYPEIGDDDFIEFDSMINIRPSQHNLTRGVDDGSIRSVIKDIVGEWIIR